MDEHGADEAGETPPPELKPQLPPAKRKLSGRLRNSERKLWDGLRNSKRRLWDGLRNSKRKLWDGLRNSWPVSLSIFGVIGSIASIYGIYPIIHDQMEARSSATYNRLSDDLYNEFYIGSASLAKIRNIVAKMQAIRTGSEAELIEIAALTGDGRKSEAKSLLTKADFAGHEVDQAALVQFYSLFIDLYDASTSCVPISVFATSRDQTTIYVGPNLTRQRLLEWIKTFHDPWLVMPVFRYHCTVDTDYDLFDYMVHNYPRSAWLYTMRGRALLERHDYDHAITDFSMALSIDDNLPDAWQGRGRGYEENGKLDYALTDYDKAIALNDTRCIAYLDRGVLKAKLKDYDGAIADASKAIALCPKEYQAYQNRATDLVKKGQTEEALRDYVFVIQNAKDPDIRLRSLSDKVSMLFSLDQKNLACREEDLQLTRKLIPDGERGAVANNMLGLCDEWNGKFLDAIRDYVAFWKYVPHDIEPMSEIEEGAAQNIMEVLYHFYPDNLQKLAPFRGDLVKVASRLLHEGRQNKGVMVAGFAGDNDQLLALTKDFPATSEKFNRMPSSEQTNTLVITFAVVIAAKSRTIPLQTTTKGKDNLRNVLLFASQPAVAATVQNFEKIVADQAAKSNSRGIAGFWPD